MAEIDDDSDDPLTLDDVRLGWAWIFLVTGLWGLIAFGIRIAFFYDIEIDPSSDSGWFIWLERIRIGGVFLMNGLFIFLGVSHLREFWTQMRIVDRLGLLLGMAGGVLLSWNAVAKILFVDKEFMIPPPTAAIVLTMGGCLLLYARGNLLPSKH